MEVKLKVEVSEDKVVELEFGNELADYTYSQYLDFVKVEYRYHRMNKEEEEEEVDEKEREDRIKKRIWEDRNGIDKVIEMLSKVVKCRSEDLGLIPFNIDGDELDKKW